MIVLAWYSCPTRARVIGELRVFYEWRVGRELFAGVCCLVIERVVDGWMEERFFLGGRAVTQISRIATAIKTQNQTLPIKIRGVNCPP